MKDKFGREIDYLRVSVTDNCNLRCVYCMEEKDNIFLKKENKLTDDYEETFKNADAQVADIISDAKKNAKVEYDKIVADAHTQAGKIVENAEKNMEVQKEKALRDMESQIADLAMSAATKVINDKSSELDNARLYDEFLGKAGDANDTDIN